MCQKTREASFDVSVLNAALLMLSDVAKWALIEPSIGIDNLFNRVDCRIDSTTRKYALYSPDRILVVGLKVEFK